ncbi:MAG: carbohydrate ABC transporter permease [Eubacteriales bacterium]|nr:carbohydrate ABC transporter permease [Kiritimatiellia bacterium]MDD4744309.1 carbohydrate ABC transporter permease [Eubacteriales bacterium]
MLNKRSKAEWFGDSINVMILGFLSLIMLYPMLYELFMSFSVASQVAKHRGVLLWPLGFTLTPYRLVFAEKTIISGYRNTFFVLSIGLVFNITFTSLGAYFLSRKNVMLFKPVMIMILITMYFSGGLVPTWLNVNNLGLYNTLWALIIPGAINTFNLILLRSYFLSIPDSLLESVFIDGGGHFTALFKVVIPVSLPAMMVMILYYGVGHWNSWFDALIYLRTRDLWPLQMVLRDILIQGTDLDIRGEELINYEQLQETTKAAIVIITTVPILMIYPFLQKYFIAGLMVGSLKG